MSRCVDITGQRFGKLVVVGKTENKGKLTAWKCLCDCGNETTITTGHLKSGHTKSCGCIKIERLTTHGKSKERLYDVWIGLKQRCNNQNSREYKHYGGRGIKVCKEWLDYQAFRDWALQNGYKENLPRGKCTLDRINVNGNYEPDNCRWVSQAEQTLNTRRSRKMTLGNETLTAKEWAEKLNVPYGRIISRVNKLGWSDKEALCELSLRESHARKRTVNR